MTGRWSVDANGRVLSGGQWATAEAVSSALADDGGRVIREQLPSLSFSRRALLPRLVADGDFPAGLRFRICVRNGEQWIQIDPNQESLVADDRWSPVHTQSLAGITAVVAKHNVPLGPVDAGQFLTLSSTPEVISFLEDLTQFSQASLWVAKSVLLPKPAALQADLYPYQLEGSSFARTLAQVGIGCLIADEMGLGKTIQAISVLADQPAGTRTLVVCPVSLLENWKREITTFAPHLNILIHQGPHRCGVPSGFDGFDVIVAPYGTVALDAGLMAQCQWDFAILDEAQQIKNPDSNRSQAMKRLRRRVSIALTGTPVENSLQDLYSIAEFVMPSLLGSRDDFLRLFPDLASAAVRLGRIISPVMVKRHVADVATDLPELIEYDQPFQLDSMDAESYLQIASERPGIEGIQLLRVLCAHATDEGPDPFREFRTKPKVEFLLATLAELFGTSQKAIVFASFTETLDRLSYLVALEEPGAFIGVLDGRVPAQARQSLVDAFSVHTGPGCLFLNPSAAGVGLNITAANHVIHFNPEWNPQVTRQATARCFRRGQRLPVFVQHLHYVDTIEARAVELAEAKLDLAHAVDAGAEQLEHGEPNE